MDRGTWKAAVHGVAKSPTRLNDFTFTFHFHALEKEMATHSGVLAWRIPGTGEPGGWPSMGSHRVGHDWSDLAAAVAAVVKCSAFEPQLTSLSFFWMFGLWYVSRPLWASSLKWVETYIHYKALVSGLNEIIYGKHLVYYWQVNILSN